jgi:hypothetical protein
MDIIEIECYKDIGRFGWIYKHGLVTITHTCILSAPGI